jgi:hypothetical protein
VVSSDKLQVVMAAISSADNIFIFFTRNYFSQKQKQQMSILSYTKWRKRYINPSGSYVVLREVAATKEALRAGERVYLVVTPISQLFWSDHFAMSLPLDTKISYTQTGITVNNYHLPTSIFVIALIAAAYESFLSGRCKSINDYTNIYQHFVRLEANHSPYTLSITRDNLALFYDLLAVVDLEARCGDITVNRKSIKYDVSTMTKKNTPRTTEASCRNCFYLMEYISFYAS